MEYIVPSNLERAQNLADTGQYEASIARSLIVIAAALKMMVEDSDSGRAASSTNKVLTHQDWCNDPTCPNSRHEIEVDQIG
jgi:hypothetical protein